MLQDALEVQDLDRIDEEKVRQEYKINESKESDATHGDKWEWMPSFTFAYETGKEVRCLDF